MITNDKLTEIYPKVYAFAVSMLRDKDRASDLVQDVIVKLMSNQTFEGTDENLLSYAFKTAQNLARDKWRKDSIRPVVDEFDQTENVIANDDPEKRIELWETVKRLDNLNSKRRNAIMMFAMGEDYEAIQKKNKHKSLITAKTTVHKAKAQLVEELEKPVVPSKTKRECAHCGSIFFQWRSIPDQMYCSRECGNVGRRIKKVDCTCAGCGTSFQNYASVVALGRGKFCSKKCKDKFMKQNVERNCRHCQNPFKLKKPSDKQVFCGNVCFRQSRKVTCEVIDDVNTWSVKYET